METVLRLNYSNLPSPNEEIEEIRLHISLWENLKEMWPQSSSVKEC